MSDNEFNAWVKDQRYFYWKANKEGLPKPGSDQADAFAERVAIKMAEGNIPEAQARHEAFYEWAESHA